MTSLQRAQKQEQIAAGKYRCICSRKAVRMNSAGDGVCQVCYEIESGMGKYHNRELRGVRR